jgi:hypothetical protein
MEPGTFEDDDDPRTERTVIGAELTGRVNGLRLLIMRGRGCADCQKASDRQKACDRKRRHGRTAHPNWPFNPLRRHHLRTYNAASVGWRNSFAGRLDRPHSRHFSHEGRDRRVNPDAPSPTNDARVNHVGPTRTAARFHLPEPRPESRWAGFQARPHHEALRAPAGETCRRCMGSYSRRQLFAPLLAAGAAGRVPRHPASGD